MVSIFYFKGWLYNPFSPFGVVIDKISRNAILPEHPLELIKKNRFENLPLIFSCVESEGLYPAAGINKSKRSSFVIKSIFQTFCENPSCLIN